MYCWITSHGTNVIWEDGSGLFCGVLKTGMGWRIFLEKVIRQKKRFLLKIFFLNFKKQNSNYENVTDVGKVQCPKDREILQAWIIYVLLNKLDPICPYPEFWMS
jgi:hypothetical protein